MNNQTNNNQMNNQMNNQITNNQKNQIIKKTLKQITNDQTIKKTIKQDENNVSVHQTIQKRKRSSTDDIHRYSDDSDDSDSLSESGLPNASSKTQKMVSSLIWNLVSHVWVMKFPLVSVFD